MTLNVNSHDVFFFFFTSFVGVFFILSSFMYLPFIIITPHKFCMLFGLGSASFFYAIVFLKGFKGAVIYFWRQKRRGLTIVYVVTFILLVYFSIIKKNFLVTFGLSLLQLWIIIKVIFGIIPGGQTTMKWIFKSFCFSCKGIYTCFKQISKVLCWVNCILYYLL